MWRHWCVAQNRNAHNFNIVPYILDFVRAGIVHENEEALFVVERILFSQLPHKALDKVLKRVPLDNLVS